MRRKNDVKQTGRYKRVNAYVMILKQIIENWFDVLRLYLYMSVEIHMNFASYNNSFNPAEILYKNFLNIFHRINIKIKKQW